MTGWAAEIPLKAVQTLEGYQAVVLGAPLFIFKWHDDAHRFLKRHRAALAQRRVAVFALGPLGSSEEAMRGSRAQLDKDLAKYPWLEPIALEMFAGKYDPEKLIFPHNLMAAGPASPLRAIPAGDYRDWDAIHAWASELIEQLR